MKKIKTLFLLSALSLAAACSDDTEMTTYAGRGDEAFFGDTAYSYTVSAELEDAYSIEVLRATPAGNASVSVAVAVADAAVASAFTAPAAVEFKNGEYAAPLKISFDRAKLTIGKENVVTVTLQSETDLPYATECSLTVTRDYTWKNYGKGVYTSPIHPLRYVRTDRFLGAADRGRRGERLTLPPAGIVPQCRHEIFRRRL
ncbi:hypothetical protein [Alistipes senegalensis]|uniref:hypothetical protein n=1 Tax=Alistipes senegalensis TaxID=1288121 RepID=UPI002676E482|nr:hypothetical protein [Alistipes senegalensis]